MAKTRNVPVTEGGILARIWDEAGGMPLEVAERILELKLPESDADRMHELAARNGEGGITKEELAEYDEYLRACGVMTVLQSKARLTLKSKPPARVRRES